MTNQTEQGAALPDKPNYHPWSQLSEFEPSGNSGEFTDAQADAIARIAFARHTGRTEWEGAQRWVLEAIKAAARPTPEGCTHDHAANHCSGHTLSLPTQEDTDLAVLVHMGYGPGELDAEMRRLAAARRAAQAVEGTTNPQAHTIRTMQAPTVKFRDRNPAVASAVAAVFPEWDVRCDDIWTGSPADIIVSPANVTGRMDGGIDQVYINRFGWQLEARLQRDIKTLYGGHLPIGQAHLITTYDDEVPMMICAPTMLWPPGYVGNTENAYQAFRAALGCALTEGVKALGRAPVLLVPGLATATGRMSGDVCAAQLRRAWDEVLVGANAVPPPEQWHKGPPPPGRLPLSC